MGIMTGLALDWRACLAVLAGTPLVSRGLMTGATQAVVRCNGHQGFGMTTLERAVAGFAGNTCLSKAAVFRCVTGGVALQASHHRVL